jgi:ABC-type transport system involved in multi-copper enzyme maturation permease subunit
MNMIRAVIWKEAHSFLRDWKMLNTLVIMPLLAAFASFYYGTERFVLSANWVLGISAVLVVWLVPLIIAPRIFSHERVENAQASVLASPISVAELFIGKALAVFLFSYLALLIGVIATVCALRISTGMLPDVCTFTMALLAVPACGLAVAEVIGVLCFLMGRSDLVIFIGTFVELGPLVWIASIRTVTSSVWVFLALTVVGLAAAVAVPLLFSKLSKTTLAR